VRAATKSAEPKGEELKEDGSKLTPPPAKRGRPNKQLVAARAAAAAAAAAAAPSNGDAAMEEADEEAAVEDAMPKAPWDDGCVMLRVATHPREREREREREYLVGSHARWKRPRSH
jgi:hypothetical protein